MPPKETTGTENWCTATKSTIRFGKRRTRNSPSTPSSTTSPRRYQRTKRPKPSGTIYIIYELEPRHRFHRTLHQDRQPFLPRLGYPCRRTEMEPEDVSHFPERASAWRCPAAKRSVWLYGMDRQTRYISLHNPSDASQAYHIRLDKTIGMPESKAYLKLSSPTADIRGRLASKYRCGDTISITLAPKEILILDFLH